MRLTTALLATLTFLCTVFLVQAAPLTLGSRHDARACARLTDCDSCVRASPCGFLLDTQSCAAKEGHPASLATSATQCKKAAARLAARSEPMATVADGIWNKMKDHVLDGGGKPWSGRHLTSTWFAHPKHKGTAEAMSVDAATALGQVSTTKGTKTKTLWIDDNAEGKATGVAHRYTKGNVAAICTDAITAGLRRHTSGVSVSSGSYSVKTPFGNNICVYVSNVQCYPKDTHATTAAPGENC